MLAAVPTLWQIAVVPATDAATGRPTPGRLWLVAVAGPQTPNVADPTIPTVDPVTLAEIGETVAALASPFVKVTVTNPPWIRITVRATLVFSDANVKTKVAEFEKRRDAKDALAKWRECLEGGDAKAGREIFAEKAEAACMRCHKVKGEGGDVGPDLAGISAKHDRAYILQSITEPNAVIAPGFENVLVTLNDGEMIAGLLSAEDANEVTLASLADGKRQKVKKADIKERATVPSAMPPGLGDVLGKRGLRDVIEYLSTVK